MNANNPNENNEELPALQHWKVGTPLPPRFQENVWRRIQASEGVASISFWQGCLNWFDALAARPVRTVSFAAIFLLIGSSAGYLRAQHATADFNNAWQTRYVQTVDPYQAPRE